MTSCSKCDKEIIAKEEISCSQCKNKYHYICEGLNELTFKNQNKNNKSKWVCSDCKYNWNKSSQTTNNKTTETSIQNLANSMKFANQKIDDLNETINKILEEMNEIRTENVKLNDINNKLNQEISDLKQQMDNIEQKNLDSSIEIIGIPSVANETCIDIVMNIAKILNTAVIVEEAYRIPITIKGENKIIARLSQESMKTAIISNYKRNKTLNLFNLNPGWPKDKRFCIINHLTKYRRLLYCKTKATIREKGYKYIWLSEKSDILIRKDENSKVQKIYTEIDILSL
ncbi:Zinc finger, FYVE/PHD-type,Zinc finger, PHD-type,Zinc finger, RING/FYVE/PHD-type,Zinc finger, PHD- [Cinara cedri]|uniref:Zinc finger, FYVE/PHD-type,Zinc finger, PHD-type,Zinc finger, RING/FYVE/PHD-type,Zinc finger, PHD n=1 Tax=Cinara cedri TaxID=506608 RepID=A0A5E4NFQ3_9HEMI|nr:Zinc finger, FYVE/PHD-type,Zinc finger, PHD-type,Zinc finger, RING/FYVE/PHD-type,Zinc finger, PHD- [Cinara cedri]